ncbi:cupin domain-containing protein, partial [Klebsiella pneumoniae]
LCGYFSFDTTGAEPLLSLLPSVVVIPSDAARSPLLGLVGAKLQNAASDFFELDLNKNYSPVKWLP